MSELRAGAGEPARVSARLALARLALEAALGVAGVVSSDPGVLGLRVTDEGGEIVPGVMAAALPDGRYSLDLHLVARLVPLPALAEQVRERVLEAAARATLGERLAEINVYVEDVVLEGPSGGDV